MRIQRHDHIVTTLHNWLKTRCAWTQRETWIMTRQRDGEDAQQAKMDIQATYEGVTYNIDVTITDALTGNTNDIKNAGTHDGHAAQQAGKRKTPKYQAVQNLIPFALEAGGRWGNTARKWIKTLTNTNDPLDIQTLRYHIAAQLQLGNAAMIKTAYG